MSAAIGTWSYKPGSLGSFELWQETEDGPHYVGNLNSLASADFVVERLNGGAGGLAQTVPGCGESVAIIDRLANIMTWLREPDWTENASIEWLKDWMNRRPIAELAMVAMLMPTEGQGKPDCGASPFLWICIVPGTWQPEHIRAWTRDPDRAAQLTADGLEMIPLFKGSTISSTVLQTPEAE